MTNKQISQDISVPNEGVISIEDAKLFFEDSYHSIGEINEFKKLYNSVAGDSDILKILGGLFKTKNVCINFLVNEIKKETEKVPGDAGLKNVTMNVLIKIAELLPSQVKALQYCYLFRRIGLGENIIKKIAKKDNTIVPARLHESLDSLNSLGLVKKENESFSLIPMVCEWIEKNVCPSMNDEPFSKIKKLEFYMYFTLESVPVDGTFYDRTIKEIKRLKSHFLEGDYIESLDIPADVPYLEEFENYCSPFQCLNEAQVNNHLGQDISVDSENEFYCSADNCIMNLSNWDYPGQKKSLLFMSIYGTKVPEFEEIEMIDGFACSYNRADSVSICDSVKCIRENAFYRCKTKKIIVDSPSICIMKNSFDFVNEDSIVELKKYITNISNDCIVGNNKIHFFDGLDIIEKDGFYYNTKDGYEIYASFENSGEIRVPDGIKIIGNLPSIDGKTVLYIPKSVEWINPYYLNSNYRIAIECENTNYALIEDSLIHLKDGTLIRCWGDHIPQTDKIVRLYDSCLKYAAFTRNTVVIIPEGTKIIDEDSFSGVTAKEIILPHSLKYIDCFFLMNTNYVERVTYKGSISQLKECMKNSLGWYNYKLTEVSEAAEYKDQIGIICNDGKVIPEPCKK